MLNFAQRLRTDPKKKQRCLFVTARAPSVRGDPECVASVSAPRTLALQGALGVSFAHPLGLAAHLHSGGGIGLLAEGTLMCPEQV